MHPTGHQKVPRALGGGLDEHGRFQLDKSLAVEIVPGRLGDPVAQHQILLQIRTAQIQIPVFQPGSLGRRAILTDLEGGCFRLIEDPQLLHGDLHIAGGNLLIPGGAHPHRAAGGHHKFAAQGERFIKHRLVRVLIKGQLYDPGAVPQIHENELSQIPLPLHPAEHRRRLSGVFLPEFSAIGRPFQSLNGFCHTSFPTSDYSVSATSPNRSAMPASWRSSDLL